MKNKFLCIGGILLSTISFTFSQSNNINQKNNNAKLFNEKIIRVNEEKEDMMQFNNENDRIIICNERELMSLTDEFCSVPWRTMSPLKLEQWIEAKLFPKITQGA